MKQKTLSDFQTSGVECPLCSRKFKSNKAFGPHFRSAHPGKHAATQRVEDAYGGNARDALIQWYWKERMTTREISEKYNVPRDGLQEVFERFDVKTRRTGNHASYRTNYNGYESWLSNDPDGVERLMKVHRLLAIAEFGIESVKDKHVHHKNGIPWDNRPDNIETITNSKHLAEHYEEREIDENGRFV